MVLSQCIEQRTGKVLCKVNVKCNVKTAKTRCLKVLATCNRRRIPLGKSHNVKIIEGGFYKVLLFLYSQAQPVITLFIVYSSRVQPPHNTEKTQDVVVIP